MTDTRAPHDTKRELRIVRIMSRCVHFTGIQHKVCDAGVSYDSVIEHKTETAPYRMACFAEEAHGLICASAKFPTREEAEQEYAEGEKEMVRFLKVHRAAHNDAKAKGLEKGHGGASSCVCPTCGGVLHYTVAGYNGHLHGHCETKGCASWME